MKNVNYCLLFLILISSNLLAQTRQLTKAPFDEVKNVMRSLKDLEGVGIIIIIPALKRAYPTSY